MFSRAGELPPCGLFTRGHFILLGVTILCIIVALHYTKNKDKKSVYKIIRNLTILVCIMEVIKIVFSIMANPWWAVNTYLPLYYCSMLIYAGLMSSFGKGKIKRIGDVFLSTGSIVGGIIFVLFPSTSLPTYPAFHIFSIHSFIFHGIMIYLGLLLNITNYIDLKKDDIKYFMVLVGMLCAIALPINYIFHSNLMFISQDAPGTPVSILYNLTNGSFIFNLIMIIGQMTLPFYIVFYFKKLYLKTHVNSIKDTQVTV